MHDGVSFYRELGEISFSNKKRYAARHGYDVISHTPSGTRGLLREVNCNGGQESVLKRRGKCFAASQEEYGNDKRAATFGKIKLAKTACIGRENWWLLWSDADAIIVNQTKSLESIIDNRWDLMITVDWLMINAGVFLMKCSPWMIDFLKEVYEKEHFNKARALDQSSLQWHIDNVKDAKEKHVKFIPKWVLNVYPEEYRAGDFLVHLAGKLYEASPEGCTALARQFDAFSYVNEVKNIEAFFSTRYLLSKYSGACVITESEYGKECKPEDSHRIRLDEPMNMWTVPNRYFHVGQRYYWLKDWKDKYDIEDWNKDRKPFIYEESESSTTSNILSADMQGDSSNFSEESSCKQERCSGPSIIGEPKKDEL